MAETPSDQSTAGIQHHWCYQCEKRVAVETLAGDVVCYECKAGFVEPVPTPAVPVPTPEEAEAAADSIDRPNFGNQLIQVLRLLSQVARDEDAAPSPQPSDGDYLSGEFDGWDNNDDEDDDDEHSVEVVDDELADNRDGSTEDNRSDGEAEWEINIVEAPEEGEEMRRRRQDVLRLRLRELTSPAAGRRNRILQWAEVLLGMDDNPIDLRLQVLDSHTYIGNPGDYVDVAGYETLLQNLADSDDAARRGAPPAAKSAVEGLENLVIGKEDKGVVCAICKDWMNVGEIGKNLPCGHGYHGDCIDPWLQTRNSCPVCRFELPTDDSEYEEERKKRAVVAGLRAASSSSSGTACRGDCTVE